MYVHMCKWYNNRIDDPVIAIIIVDNNCQILISIGIWPA